eukprot:scaffold143282_cov76-Cyclotella_meneghiniana.AAC.3
MKRDPAENIRPDQECFGCGKVGDHPWSRCPERTNPQAVVRAKAKSAEFRKARQAKYSQYRKDRRIGNGEPNFSDLTANGQKKIRDQVLAAVANAPPPDLPVTPSTAIVPAQPTSILRGSGRGNTTTLPRIFLTHAIVMASIDKPLIPVPINSNLPHIVLELGSANSEHDPIKVRAVVDTAASLSTASLPFLVKLATMYPWAVHEVFTAKSHSPITLYGVVKENDKGMPVTTELPVAFNFHLPYYTKDGQTSTLMVAAGHHVNVNMILGLPFLEAARSLIDLDDNVIDFRALECPPFPIISRRATLDIPVDADSNAAGAAVYEPYQEFIEEVLKVGEGVANVHAARSPSSNHVRFDLDQADRIAAELSARRSNRYPGAFSYGRAIPCDANGPVTNGSRLDDCYNGVE